MAAVTVLGAGLALALVAPNCLHDAAHRDDTVWLKQHCRILQEEDAEPLVERARAIFERLRRVVPIGLGVRPELLLVADSDELHAYRTRTGAIVMSARALRFCYGQERRSEPVGPSDGDSRLAFVLAHELRHVAQLDPPAAFDNDIEVREPMARARAARELQADMAAIVDMTRAGFRPGVVLEGSLTFLGEWARARGVPSPSRERAETLRAVLGEVAGALPLHESGVLFLHAGRHEDAAELLQAFVDRAQFPGREVLSDIGFAHHQLALRLLYLCDRAEAVRFRLPAVVDPETLAVQALLRDAPQGALDCRSDHSFVEEIRRALEALTAAVESDPAYAPARMNLVAALITAGELTRAMSEAEEAPAAGAEWPEPERLVLDDLYAVAQYLWGDASQLDDVRGQALAKLRELAARAPGDADVAYNLARMTDEQAWRRFLALEPGGLWGAAAREELRVTAPPSGAAADEYGASEERGCSGDGGLGPAPAVPLGPVRAETRQRFRESSKALDAGARGLHVHRGEGFSAFELVAGARAAIELVVEELRPPLALDAIRERLGPPRAEVPLVGGRRVLRYDGCAYEIDASRAVRRVVFRPSR